MHCQCTGSTRRRLLFDPLASDGSICDADRHGDAQLGQPLCEVPAGDNGLCLRFPYVVPSLTWRHERLRMNTTEREPFSLIPTRGANRKERVVASVRSGTPDGDGLLCSHPWVRARALNPRAIASARNFGTASIAVVLRREHAPGLGIGVDWRARAASHHANVGVVAGHDCRGGLVAREAVGHWEPHVALAAAQPCPKETPQPRTSVRAEDDTRVGDVCI